MISLLYLVSALILGYSVTRQLGLKLLPFEKPALTAILGLVLWTWLAFVLSLLLPYSISLPLTVVVAAGVSVVLWRRSRPPGTMTLPGGR
ncbi:MAG TPA: hypothetical protein VHQ86_00550, partial [Candidatus Saccharimonadia bacterium]|nr:hypothetical protein [Candidatus Saccharimonadia bacterium]